jgi:hypothetical protein
MSITMKSIASKIRRDIRHLGLVRTAYRIFMEAINLCFGLRIIRVFKKEGFDPHFLKSNQAFHYKFLDESQMFELARNPDYHLTEDFVRTALEKGDKCYGAFDGEALACFAWYSTQPTDDDGLTLHFKPGYYYGYAGFTHPQYRGRRLMATRGNRARREYLRHGFKGEVFTIDSHNFRSLRSASASLGIQDIGYIVVLKIGKHAWIHASRGCREHGIYLTMPAAAVEPVPAAR